MDMSKTSKYSQNTVICTKKRPAYPKLLHTSNNVMSRFSSSADRKRKLADTCIAMHMILYSENIYIFHLRQGMFKKYLWAQIAAEVFSGNLFHCLLILFAWLHRVPRR